MPRSRVGSIREDSGAAGRVRRVAQITATSARLLLPFGAEFCGGDEQGGRRARRETMRRVATAFEAVRKEMRRMLRFVCGYGCCRSVLC
eukprot:366430-Chlamydomonas_euryale.AAC.18